MPKNLKELYAITPQIEVSSHDSNTYFWFTADHATQAIFNQLLKPINDIYNLFKIEEIDLNRTQFTKNSGIDAMQAYITLNFILALVTIYQGDPIDAWNYGINVIASDVKLLEVDYSKVENVIPVVNHLLRIIVSDHLKIGEKLDKFNEYKNLIVSLKADINKQLGYKPKPRLIQSHRERRERFDLLRALGDLIKAQDNFDRIHRESNQQIELLCAFEISKDINTTGRQEVLNAIGLLKSEDYSMEVAISKPAIIKALSIIKSHKNETK